MNQKTVLRWIGVSLISAAPFIELTRIILDNYQMFISFDPSNLHPSRELNLSDLHAILFALKYFFFLFGIGVIVQWKYFDYDELGMFTVVAHIYCMVIMFLSFALLCFAINGMVYLFQLNPFVFISILLICLSLLLSKDVILSKNS